MNIQKRFQPEPPTFWMVIVATAATVFLVTAPAVLKAFGLI